VAIVLWQTRRKSSPRTHLQSCSLQGALLLQPLALQLEFLELHQAPQLALHILAALQRRRQLQQGCDGAVLVTRSSSR
jgi:hypothetical protein